MDQLMRLKDVVISYISPTAKRQRTLESHFSSPENETCSFTPPELEYISHQGDDTMLEFVHKKLELQSPTVRCRKRTRDEFEEKKTTSMDESNAQVSCDKRDSSEPLKLKIEADEEMLNIPLEAYPNSVPSPSIKEESESESEVELETESLSQDMMNCERLVRDEATEKVQEYLKRQAELEIRKDDVARVRALGNWHPDEIYLFERLSLRSFEVILPESWKVDFPTLPYSIFAENNNEDTFFSTHLTSSSHGVKALQSLLNLGVRVRDNLATRAPTEKLIIKEINNYIKWSERDGGFVKMRYIPVLVTIAARPKQNIESLSTAIDGKMKSLAEKYRRAYKISGPDGGPCNEYSGVEMYNRQPPLLYGIIVAQTIVILVTLDSADPDASTRHMQHFDFREKGTDAWIGFAIAMTVIVARNYIMSIKDELEVDSQPDSDVDM